MFYLDLSPRLFFHKSNPSHYKTGPRNRGREAVWASLMEELTS